MADLAELGFVVHDDPLKRAWDWLTRLIPAANNAQKATDRFNKTARDSQSATARMASGMSNVMVIAARFATAVAGAFSIHALANYADAWSDMQSRVGAAIKDMEAAPVLMQRILDIANASYSPLAQTVEIYGRNVAVLRDLGKSSAEAADFTESLNHMLVITATRGERAESVQNALSKAMAVGKLQAEGLETVLANGGRVAEALAAELGTTVSGLRGLASQGKITGSVIANAIIKPLETVREGAGAMPATITDAFTILNNNVTAAIGTLDKATGASSAVAGAIIDIANNLHVLTPTVAGLAAVVLTALTPAIVGATVAMIAFTASMLANPLTAIAVVVGLVVARLVTLIQEMGGVQEAFHAVRETAIDVWTRITSAVTAFGSTMNRISDEFTGYLTEKWIEVLRLIIDGISSINRTLNTNFDLTGLINTTADAMARVDKYSASAAQHGENAAAAWERVFAARSQSNSVGDGAGAFSAFTTQMGVATQAATTATTQLTDSQKKAAAAYAEVVKGAKEFITEQRLEAQTLGMTTVQANTLRYAQDLLNKATADGRSVTAAQRNELLSLAAQMAQTEAETKRLTEAYEFGKQTLGSFFSDFKNELMNGTSLWGAFGKAAINVLNNIADKAMSMATNGIWDMIFGSIFGGGFGSIAGGASIPSGGFIPGLTGPKLFASGGYTGNMSTSAAAGVVHGQEYVLNAQATKRIGLGTLNALNDNMPVNFGANDNTPVNVEFNPRYAISGVGLSMAEIQEVIQNANQQMIDDLPDVIQSIQADPRKRVNRK